MTLGIALLLIFVLYLVDKHRRWRPLLAGAIVVIIFFVLLVVGTLLNLNAEKRAHQKAEDAACVARAGPGSISVLNNYDRVCAVPNK
jgi:uncharacterized membrane protein